MSSKDISLQRQLSATLLTGDLATCQRAVSEELKALPRSPFHIVLDLNITTDAEAFAEFFDNFFRQVANRFPIGAAYTEMNGFCINTDLWFCNLFAYQQYGGHDDYDWLARWQAEDPGAIAIEGLEPLQEVYGSPAFRDKNFYDACSVTDLLVVIKFQEFVHRASAHMKELKFPLLVTAHDYDFIHEVKPGR
ncbi:hypothetical protein Cflav_PD4227 [Pedosphaera parvula Ellin514]|uniref:Uncharacterized protein n=2 Tax=Pedosphaera TaxID=1032526 RepID=B9XF51_PEDPL|nr:hypothetical protein Cflav_PD4227 [Pedosphaera parvula Ellin514]